VEGVENESAACGHERSATFGADGNGVRYALCPCGATRVHLLHSYTFIRTTRWSWPTEKLYKEMHAVLDECDGWWAATLGRVWLNAGIENLRAGMPRPRQADMGATDV
jgi:hypothetical protein